METNLQFLIPLRNPTDVLTKSIASLVTQTDRDFSVLVSDNHSTSGGEFIDEAVKELRTAGIPVQKIQPAAELERIEHWNWLHFQTQAKWVKPLFAGDWLEPDYIASVRHEIGTVPECRYVYSGYRFHDASSGGTMDVIPAWAGGFRGAADMRDVVLRYGHQFGPPSCAAYQSDAFCAVGGYCTTLPICADSLFFCALAQRFGAIGIARILSNFQMHSARFSTLLPGRRKAVLREQLTYILALFYHARTEKWPVSHAGMLKMLARELRDYWWKKA
jgi:hypothetical protein